MPKAWVCDPTGTSVCGKVRAYLDMVVHVYSMALCVRWAMPAWDNRGVEATLNAYVVALVIEFSHLNLIVRTPVDERVRVLWTR